VIFSQEFPGQVLGVAALIKDHHDHPVPRILSPRNDGGCSGWNLIFRVVNMKGGWDSG
jgi:hypothetical protein